MISFHEHCSMSQSFSSRCISKYLKCSPLFFRKLINFRIINPKTVSLNASEQTIEIDSAVINIQWDRKLSWYILFYLEIFCKCVHFKKKKIAYFANCPMFTLSGIIYQKLTFDYVSLSLLVRRNVEQGTNTSLYFK